MVLGRCAQLLPLVALLPLLLLLTVQGGWIDPDTRSADLNRTSYMTGKLHKLVFSDEFNTPHRNFHDGSDPRWTAINKDDYTNYALQYYNADLASTTADGFLNISTIVKDVHFKYTDVKTSSKPMEKTKNYQSAMIQGWNKFCFTGGIVEVSARLPGDAYIGGLWPAMWLLGNLARATYVGSSNNIWPWSFDTCRQGSLQHQQRFSACNTATHYDFLPKKGRGAPEIDILEAMPGKEKLHHTSTEKPYYSASLQVSPGVEDYRPDVGLPPRKGKWYENGLEYGENTSQNIFFYGMHLEGSTKDKSYLADAVSANRNIGPTHFNEQHVYRVEWVPGPQGYIVWHLDGELVYHIKAETLDLTHAIIPEEPMYLLFNTAVSSTWGFPTPCPDGCACDCFDCRKQECACAIPANMCDMFEDGPASLLVDYVRVYQLENDKSQIVGCSTPTHPTKRFIQGHKEMYMGDNDKQPMLPVAHGGGSCSVDADCGGLIASEFGSSKNDNRDSRLVRGVCERNRCRCLSAAYTGPQCRSAAGFDDIIWDADKSLLVSWLVPQTSLIIFVAVGVLVLVILAVWKYNHERFMRSFEATRRDNADVRRDWFTELVRRLSGYRRVGTFAPLQQYGSGSNYTRKDSNAVVQMNVRGANSELAGSSDMSTTYQSI